MNKLLILISFVFSLSALGSLTDFNREWVSHLEQKATVVSDIRHLPYSFVHPTKTKYSIIVTHGLFESPYYMTGIGQSLYYEGYNVLSVLLPGHWEKDLKSIDHISAIEWKKELDKTIELASMIGEKIILIGHSTGGLLSLEPMIEHDERIAAAVLLAPAIKISKKVKFAASLGKMFNIDINKLTDNLPDGYDVPYVSASGSDLVQNSIERILGQNKKERILHYQKIRKPIFLIYPEADLVIDNGEYENLINSVNAEMRVKIFSRQTGVDHASISKTAIDTYIGFPTYFNHEAGEMVREMVRFIREL